MRPEKAGAVCCSPPSTPLRPFSLSGVSAPAGQGHSSRAPVVSIASIRGRATGVGSELALASDMRFASREKAILSQWEVGAGLVPGGGPMARLPRLIGRGRALEVLLGADDVRDRKSTRLNSSHANISY